MENYIIRNTDSLVSAGQEDCMIADLMRHTDPFVRSAGKEPEVVIHVGTNDKVQENILEATFRLIGKRLKPWPHWEHFQKYF